MYLNTVRFIDSEVILFLTSSECFSPSNPVYKAVQVALEEMGYKPTCNHVFKGCLGNLHFTHTKIDDYFPSANKMRLIEENKKQLTHAYGFIADLEYVFTTGILPENVGKILI